MPRRWNWDFEDERRAREVRLPAIAPVPSRPAPPTLPERRTLHRRRRGAAALVLLGLAVVLTVALSGSHGGRTSTASAQAKHALAQRAAAPAPSDTPAAQDSAVRSVLAYTPFVKQGSSRTREVALTFDDGPGPYTPQVLSVLERMHVQATFFVIGRMLQYFSAATTRAIRDGDVIGDHTETHPEMAKLSAHEQYEQLFEQIARIELLGGRRPTLFRPPYGSFDATTFHELHRLHLLMVLWSVDTDDYQQPGVPAIVQSALAGAHPGAIILMHDAGGTRTQTIEALPQIISGLRARGYRLVTVPQLVKDNPPPAGQPIPPNLSGD